MRSKDPAGSTEASERPLSASLRSTALRLTRQARDADSPAAAAHRRARGRLLDAVGYEARERSTSDQTILVLHPREWVVDGRVDPAAIDDISRAVELQVEGPGAPEQWDTVARHNEAVAEAVAETHGPVHGANARAFATYMSNHLARPVEEATDSMRREFRTEYFPRNAWPSDQQRAVVERSLVHVETQAGPEN